jgi:hypothetical protein
VPPVEQPPATPPAGGKKKRSGGSRKKKSADVYTEAAKTAAQIPASAQPRKPGKSRALAAPYGKQKRAPKFDLQTILAATAGLKEADMPAFQKGLNLLMDVAKAGRVRVLAALGKVFS